MAASFRRLMEDSREMSRRSFLAITGWIGFSVASAIALYQSLKFVYPNATYEDPPAFKADPPTTYAVGSTTVLIDKRVVINHDPNGFYAISLICTHLGCTPRYFDDVTSDLVSAGTSISKDPDTGQKASKARPALRPMDRVHLEVAPDGKLLIDRSVIVDRAFRLKVYSATQEGSLPLPLR